APHPARSLLSLPDALPISALDLDVATHRAADASHDTATRPPGSVNLMAFETRFKTTRSGRLRSARRRALGSAARRRTLGRRRCRSEEHTSELQSRENLVCR